MWGFDPRRSVGLQTPAARYSRMMLTLRWLATIFAVVLASVLTAIPAFAHAALISSDPANGAQLDASPARITLTFNQDVEPQFATVTVSGPDGTAYADGAVRVDGPDAVIDVKPLGPAASYVVAYRVISADGHPITGQYTFEVTEVAPAPANSAAPATAQPSAAEPASYDQGFPVWIAVAVTVVLAAVALVMVRRSR